MMFVMVMEINVNNNRIIRYQFDFVMFVLFIYKKIVVSLSYESTKKVKLELKALCCSGTYKILSPIVQI